jgi:serine/threonine protein kinase
MCYRRYDTAGEVDRIYDDLAPEFGMGAIFRDINAIPPGVDFPTYIQNSLRGCPVALIFIGRDWATCTDSRGRLRIEDPDDHVRVEVETALALPDCRVIPVFVRDASVPTEHELPESLRPLRRRSGIAIRTFGLDYKHDIAHFSKVLKDVVKEVLGARDAAAEQLRRKEAEAREREAKEQRRVEEAAAEEQRRKDAEAREREAKEQRERELAEQQRVEKAAVEEQRRKEAEAREREAKEQRERELAEQRRVEEAAAEEKRRKEADAREREGKEQRERELAEQRRVEAAAAEEQRRNEAETREREAKEQRERELAEQRRVEADERRRKEAEAREREAKEKFERELAEQRRVEEEERLAVEAQQRQLNAEFGLRSLAAGRLVAGRFRLEKFLGQGGMGVVWRARDEDLRKTRALKFLKEDLANDPGAIAALKDEVGRCQELTQRHIIRLFDLVKDEARGFVAVSMEVAEGGSLTTRRLEKPHRWFEPEELLPWVGQLCEALTYIHEEAGLVHRDIKPANLLLDGRGRLKLSDFGISGSLTESLSRLTGEQPSTGTPAYMSPEQACGKAPRLSDDLYALGSTLYELLTGQPPFTGSPEAVRAQLLSDTPAPPIGARRSMIEKVNAPIPRAWEDAIASLLAKKAADRPDSARKVMERLRTSADAFEEAHPRAAVAETLPADREHEAPEMPSSEFPQEVLPDVGALSAAPGDLQKDNEQMATMPPKPAISTSTPQNAREFVEEVNGCVPRAPEELPVREEPFEPKRKSAPSPPSEQEASPASLFQLLRIRHALSFVEALRLGDALAATIDAEELPNEPPRALRLHQVTVCFSDAPPGGFETVFPGPSPSREYRMFHLARFREPVTDWPSFHLKIDASDARARAAAPGAVDMATIFPEVDSAGDLVQQLARLLYELLGGVAGSRYVPLASSGEKGNSVLRIGIEQGTAAFPFVRELVAALRAVAEEAPRPASTPYRREPPVNLQKTRRTNITGKRRLMVVPVVVGAAIVVISLLGWLRSPGLKTTPTLADNSSPKSTPATTRDVEKLKRMEENRALCVSNAGNSH